MANPQPVWDATKTQRPGPVPPDTGPAIIAELIRNQQAPLFTWVHDAHPANKNWDCTFGMAFQVTLNGWTYFPVVHLHVKKKGKTYQFGDGGCYVPGYLHWSTVAPDFSFNLLPGYDPGVHVSGWSDDVAARANFFTGLHRYPL